jgi:hypothetical protein
MAAYSFDLPSVRQGVDIQNPLVFSKPYRGLHWRPIPFETLKVEISLTRKGGKVWARHRKDLHARRRCMLSCHIVPGMRRPSVQPTAVGDKYGGEH